MSVLNFLCEDCKKRRVCGFVGKLDKFSDNAKKDLGINITMDSCRDYDEDNDDEVEADEE